MIQLGVTKHAIGSLTPTKAARGLLADRVPSGRRSQPKPPGTAPFCLNTPPTQQTPQALPVTAHLPSLPLPAAVASLHPTKSTATCSPPGRTPSQATPALLQPTCSNPQRPPLKGPVGFATDLAADFVYMSCPCSACAVASHLPTDDPRPHLQLRGCRAHTEVHCQSLR